MLHVFGEKMVGDEVDVVEEHLAPGLLLGSGHAVSVEVNMPFGLLVASETPAEISEA